MYTERVPLFIPQAVFESAAPSLGTTAAVLAALFDKTLPTMIGANSTLCAM